LVSCNNAGLPNLEGGERQLVESSCSATRAFAFCAPRSAKKSVAIPGVARRQELCVCALVLRAAPERRATTARRATKLRAGSGAPLSARSETPPLFRRGGILTRRCAPATGRMGQTPGGRTHHHSPHPSFERRPWTRRPCSPARRVRKPTLGGRGAAGFRTLSASGTVVTLS